jgi:hypothetical protein
MPPHGGPSPRDREDNYRKALTRDTRTIILSSPLTRRMCESIVMLDSTCRRLDEQYGRRILDSYRYRKACTDLETLIAEFDSRLMNIRNGSKNNQPKAVQHQQPRHRPPQTPVKAQATGKPAAPAPAGKPAATAAPKGVAAPGAKPDAPVATQKPPAAIPAKPATAATTPAAAAGGNGEARKAAAATTASSGPAATAAAGTDVGTGFKSRVKAIRAKAMGSSTPS